MAITVRQLDNNNDWTFGYGLASYIDEDNAIKQNVATRIKSLKNDYFLDTEANIDWFGILGQLNNKQTILNEIYRVTINTDGVLAVTDVNVLEVDKRNATIEVKFATINSENILLQIGLI